MHREWRERKPVPMINQEDLSQPHAHPFVPSVTTGSTMPVEPPSCNCAAEVARLTQELKRAKVEMRVRLGDIPDGCQEYHPGAFLAGWQDVPLRKVEGISPRFQAARERAWNAAQKFAQAEIDAQMKKGD